MRIAVDIGGTFTDLVLESREGLRLFKSPTVPTDPMQGVVDVLRVAAAECGVSLEDLLGRTEVFIHATTRGLNAVLTGTTARTAFLTTAGHPDVLLLREGGRDDAFDFTVPFPQPYVPRSLTFEVPGRITSTGDIIEPLDTLAVERVCQRLVELDVDAVGVCLLWSTVNPEHELTVGQLLSRNAPGVACTLSHQLNPSLREYRRASSACIDASLKPIMTEYLAGLTQTLDRLGFTGRVLIVSSIGGVLDVVDAAAAPITTINSGPSMAPVAGRAYAASDATSKVVIVADAGGTTYDVTLVRDGRIPWTRSAWVGRRLTGHMTGLPSVDVKSIGAGGGSIAWVDDAGLLHIGPQSAGSVPGPACYGRGGTAATLTDAALVLGYLDAERFSGGTMTLDVAAAQGAVSGGVGGPLGLSGVEAAEAVMRLTTEQMVRAIEDITLEQGIDPTGATLVGGGGAAGLNAVWVAQRLGCDQLVVPSVGAALAAAGALMSEPLATFSSTVPTTSTTFDQERVNAALDHLRARCQAFADRVAPGSADVSVQLFAEAHYPQQIWELEVPLRVERFEDEVDVADLVTDFHTVHHDVLGIADVTSEVEVVSWGARVRCALGTSGTASATSAPATAGPRERQAYVPGRGVVPVPVRPLGSIGASEVVDGPALVELPFTTVVLPPSTTCQLGPSGSLVVSCCGRSDRTTIREGALA
jgi:N-methylhydantoinase A